MAERSTLEVDLEGFQESKNIMIHSWPGQGKTVWATGAPNCSLFSAEPGAISAKLFGRRGVGLVRINEWNDAVKIRSELERGRFDHREWVIIDTISSLQNKNQNSVLDKAVSDNPKRDPDIPAIQDYQKQQNSLKRWVEAMVDYPGVNKIWLAHTLRIEDQDGGAMFIPTILGGADKGYPVANYVMGLMNAVGYMEMRGKTTTEGEVKKREMVRRILWQPYHDEEKDVRYIAKDHFGAFGRMTDNLDFAGHLALIEAKQLQADEAEVPEEPKPETAKKAAPRRRAAANA